MYRVFIRSNQEYVTCPGCLESGADYGVSIQLRYDMVGQEVNCRSDTVLICEYYIIDEQSLA